MLTVRELQPTVTDVHQLQKNGDYVGYHKGTFEGGFLKQHNLNESKILAYENTEEYVEALSKGSSNGGVSAIFHGISYIKLFLAKYCTVYTMVGPVYKAAGMGFVFPKGSPLVSDISRGILNVTEGDTMLSIEKEWFHTVCPNEESPVSFNTLTFRSFWELFLIIGAASTCALMIFLVELFYKNWHVLRHSYPNESVKQKFSAWFKYYNRKDPKFYPLQQEETVCANSNIDVINRYAAITKATANHDELNNRLRIPSLSDVDSDLCDEEITSIELVTPCIEN